MGADTERYPFFMINQRTVQQCLNILCSNDSATTGLSAQEAINKYKSQFKTGKTEQNWANEEAGSSSKIDLSFQEYLFTVLKTPCSLTGCKTDYSEQELLNIAIDNSVTMATLFP
jgi:hypothetical protein